MAPRFTGPQGLDPFNTFQREMGRVFDEVVRGFGGFPRGNFSPNLDVHDCGDRLEVSAELPGLQQDDIDLRLEGDLLTLCGEKRDAREASPGGAHLSERSYGRFQRSFRLPFSPDPAQVQARFEHGVLHVTLTRPTQQGAGRIPIHAGSGAAPAPQAATSGDSPPVPAGGSQNAPPQRPQSAPPQRSSKDEIDLAAEESFPASDPPAWSGGTTAAGAPTGSSTPESSTPGPSGASQSG
jgi:HSP20 family protein